MGRVKWSNVLMTVLIFIVVFLWHKYSLLSKQSPYKIIIIENQSDPGEIIKSVEPQEVLQFEKNEYSLSELSESRSNLLINIYKLEMSNSSLFVLSPEKSLYFTTALGDTLILEQTSDYAILYTKDFPLFSYDNQHYVLIPGFDGLYLLVRGGVLDYYTYDVFLNESNITIVNKGTGFERVIQGVKMVRVVLDNVYFITYTHEYDSVEQIVLPTKPFSIIRVHLPENSFFVGLTSNGVNTLTFHFMKEDNVQYFIGMINTYGVVHPQNSFFFLYSKFD